MNNLKKIISVVIIFTAIMVFPAVAQDTQYQEVEAVETVQAVEEVAVAAVSEEIEAQEDGEYKINLNFNFQDNKANFIKAVDILLIGFSIVFIVMIIFIFVSKGIDKMFPYRKEE